MLSLLPSARCWILRAALHYAGAPSFLSASLFFDPIPNCLISNPLSPLIVVHGRITLANLAMATTQRQWISHSMAKPKVTFNELISKSPQRVSNLHPLLSHH